MPLQVFWHVDNLHFSHKGILPLFPRAVKRNLRRWFNWFYGFRRAGNDRFWRRDRVFFHDLSPVGISGWVVYCVL
jgi:hypothetical protein